MLDRLKRPASILCLLGTPALVSAQTAAPPKSLVLTFNITLSSKAAARLAQGEALVLSADFDAEPTPAARPHANEIGRIDLLHQQTEIPGRPGPATLHVSTARMPLRQTHGPIHLNVNIFTARHTSPDNLVTCDFFDGPLTDALALHPIPIHCALIPENYATRSMD